MDWYIITLTITTFLSTDHPRYFCFLTAEVNGKHESKTIDIDTANKIMWQLKKKGWETKTTAEYNPYTPTVYDRKIRWMHLDTHRGED